MGREPYLPEHAPPPIPAGQTRPKAWRTLLLWVVLTVMFLVFWQFLTPAERGPAAAPPRCVAPCVEPSGPWGTILVAAVPIAVMVLVVVSFKRQFRASTTFNAEQEPAFRAIAHRRFAEAVAHLRVLAKKYEKQPGYRIVIDLGIADAELWAGNLEKAIDACVAVDKTTIFGVERGARVMAAGELAFLYALSGDVPAAERWRDETRARFVKTNDPRMLTASKLRLAEAVLACRRGAPREAIELLDEVWLELRFSFIANWMRVAEVIRAFAEAQGDVREQNVVAGRLVRIEPVIGNELAFLGRKWPEMHAFLAAHGLSQTTA